MVRPNGEAAYIHTVNHGVGTQRLHLSKRLSTGFISTRHFAQNLSLRLRSRWLNCQISPRDSRASAGSFVFAWRSMVTGLSS
jgi:hypothetical protein